MKRTDLRGSTVPNDEHTYTEAIADYEGPDDKTLKLSIHDNPAGAVDAMSSKVTTFKGFPVVSESESSDHASIQLIVGERFIVDASGDKAKVTDLKSALEKVDLAKLASWKSEGMPKK